jgi:hypothetical protein
LYLLSQEVHTRQHRHQHILDIVANISKRTSHFRDFYFFEEICSQSLPLTDILNRPSMVELVWMA